MQSLPPGQHLIKEFPRFGAQLARPSPLVPEDPVIKIRGAVTEAFDVPVDALATLPRRELTADFHCVAGWSVTGLNWRGVAFDAFYRAVIEPRVSAEAPVTHLVFAGLDGYRSTILLEDALGADVVIADHLDGRPLDGDHGAPVRVVSPSQYGYLSTKHLARIEVHTSQPRDSRLDTAWLGLLKRHRRARVWAEERHRHLPARAVRPVYRALGMVMRAAGARRSHRGGPG